MAAAAALRKDDGLATQDDTDQCVYGRRGYSCLVPNIPRTTFIHPRLQQCLGLFATDVELLCIPQGIGLCQRLQQTKAFRQIGYGCWYVYAYKTHHGGDQHGFLESTFLSCTTESYNLLLTRVEAAVDALNLFLLNLVRFCGPAQKSRL